MIGAETREDDRDSAAVTGGGAGYAPLGRNRVIENQVWHVDLVHVREQVDPDTCIDIPDYLVISPRQVRVSDRVGGVGVLPIFSDGVVLLPNFRHAMELTCLEIPRGFVDAGETPSEAAARELHEEAGIGVSVDQLVPLGCMMPEASTIAARGALFAVVLEQTLASIIQSVSSPDLPADPHLLEAGLGKPLGLSFQEIHQKLDRFEIEEAFTSTALYRADRLGLLG